MAYTLLSGVAQKVLKGVGRSRPATQPSTTPPGATAIRIGGLIKSMTIYVG
jgi:hypothetical protein